jgi:CBS domain-containing protein
MSKVKDLMTKRVVTVPEDMDIECICNILVKNSLSGVPVINNKSKIVGFVSERDLISVIASGDFQDKKAKDFMCKKVTTVREDSSVSQVTKIFAVKPIRHLPVVKKGEVIGIISRRDVVKRLLSA